MLTTETYTLDEALADLEGRIEELEATLEDLDSSTDEADAYRQRRDRLRYQQTGLRWQRDEEDWGDADIEIGALTAGEKAMMHREAPDSAGRDEMQLWFVAASTATAPYVHDDLGETFAALADTHPAFVQWAEAKANGLGVPSESGNESSTSSTATTAPASETSTDVPDSTTTSSSASPTE